MKPRTRKREESLFALPWWAYLVISFFLIIIALSGLAFAGWSQASVTLKPGESKVATFTNPDNAPMSLSVTNISAPLGLLPYVLVSPSSVSENSVTDVTVTFVYIPKSVRDNITPDVYSVRVDSLIVYLDMSGVPENAENLISRIENIESSLRTISTRLDNLSLRMPENLAVEVRSLARELENRTARLIALENASSGNWRAELTSLNNWVQTRFSEVIAMIPTGGDNIENSGGVSRGELENYASLFSGQLAQLKQQTEDAKSKSLTYSVLAGAMAVIVTLGILMYGGKVRIKSGAIGWARCPDCGMEFQLAGQSKCPGCGHEFKSTRVPPRGEIKPRVRASAPNIEKPEEKKLKEG